MPKKKVQKIVAWSFSRWSAYDQCPFKLKCSAIDKLPEPKSPAMERGTKIHNLADNYTIGKLKKLPKELDLFEEEFKELRQLYKEGDIDAEQMLCFDKDWNLVSDKWSPEIWCRIKTDVTELQINNKIKVVDHKTGQLKEDGYINQLELYALGCMLAYEDILEVETQLWFIDHGEIRPVKPLVFKIGDVNKLKKKWEKKTKKMLNDTRFEATPNEYCKWCNFRKAKGGPCKY